MNNGTKKLTYRSGSDWHRVDQIAGWCRIFFLRLRIHTEVEAISIIKSIVRGATRHQIIGNWQGEVGASCDRTRDCVDRNSKRESGSGEQENDVQDGTGHVEGLIEENAKRACLIVLCRG